MAQLVKIASSEVNIRTTSLRARITDAVAIKKGGSPDELAAAERRFDEAVAKWKQSVF